ncbi:3-epi-6-deoxocathasterone 23-monooxygenase CYP90D1 [Camellia lanceoleosa]|uniref:3-epi-6-deoxocathasterone 23-monooxygenase CYP90D1 n=1 Tax=Camellia lanceoleosa TaxID=1840588 RepID=A0ACC0FX39_9ERIC|nr:3-epi-6-deoxocathasterone 23-monooxygenase CYP90D1 [Camellia lanceoleosa]
MGKSSILLITGSLQRRIHGLIGSFFKSSHLKAQITQDMHKYLQQSMEDWRDDHPIYIQDEAKNLQDLMREDLRNFFQSPFCFPDPKMATVLFPSLTSLRLNVNIFTCGSYTYSGEASEEFDRDDNTHTHKTISYAFKGYSKST